MDTQPIIDAVTTLAKHELITEPRPDDLALAVLPQGRTLHDLRPYLELLRDAPRRIETTARHNTVDSLIEYLKRFRNPDTAVFADWQNSNEPQLVAIVDFHGQGADAAPRFGKHRAVYCFPVSDQIRAWSAISGKPLAHDEMASFINERQYDIANPPVDWMQLERPTLELILHLLNLSDDIGNLDDAALDNPGAGMTARDRRAAPAPDEGDEPDDRYVPRSAVHKLRQIRFGSATRLIQLARTVELSINAVASEGYSPKTGERTIVFKEEHETRDKDGRRVVVPDAFLLRVPVFESESVQLIPVRLQYRRSGQHGIKWFLTLVEWRRVLRFAVRTEAERVGRDAAVPVFYGKAG
jgi:hypothetical protein